MRLLLPLLAFACVLSAQEDPEKAFHEAEKRLRAADKRFWEDFQGRFNDAFLAFRAPVEAAEAKPDQNRDAVWDYKEFRKLYDEYAGFEKAFGEAAIAFAKSGSPKAAAHLLEAALDAAKEAEELETELADAKPVQRRSMFDLRPGIRRHGLGFREAALVQGLGAADGAGPFLADTGWKQAVKKDGAKSIARRVMVIDAMGLSAAPEARPVLEAMLKAKESSLRIAALEALARFGAEATPALLPLLKDPSAPVQRALLQAVRDRLARDGRWIPAVVALHASARGLLRSLCVATLGTLTRQTFGDDALRWKEWLDIYAKEIEGGTFDAEKIEIQEAQPRPPATESAFYGVKSPSLAPIYLVEASYNLLIPADLDFQLTRYKYSWVGSDQRWQAEHPNHRTALLAQLRSALAGLPPEAAFNVVALHSAFEAEPLSEKKMLRATPKDRATAEKFLEKLPGQGWCAQYAGLLQAMRIAGMPPEGVDFPDAAADTIFLVNAGGPAGGHYMSPEAVVSAFGRFNRFRRLVVHCIRISDDKEPGETLMKGLAESSGGVYVWQTKGPPAG